MWIFTNYGFVSAVQHNAKQDAFLVRAREPGVLEEFAKRHKINTVVRETPDADYRYRAEIERTEFAAAVAVEILSIDYGNFKSAFRSLITENTGVTHWALLDVWTVMRDLQEHLAGCEFNAVEPPVQDLAQTPGKKKGNKSWKKAGKKKGKKKGAGKKRPSNGK